MQEIEREHGYAKSVFFYTYKIIIEETDENNKMTISNLMERLRDYGFESLKRDTIKENLNCLVCLPTGIQMQVEKPPKPIYTWYDKLENEDSFEDEELFLLAHAVMSCRLLDKKNTSNLLKKISRLTEPTNKNKIKKIAELFQHESTVGKSVFYTLSAITEAIETNKQIYFKYSDYKFENGKVVEYLRKNGSYYFVSPYYLTWKHDILYLGAFKHDSEESTTPQKYIQQNKHNFDSMILDTSSLKTFRIDRMKNVSVIESNDIKRALHKGNASDYLKELESIFDMYSSEDKRLVTFEFDPSLLGTMIDTFGNSDKYSKHGEKLRISHRCQISPPFWGWLFKFSDRIKIVDPPELVQSAKEQLSRILNNYK